METIEAIKKRASLKTRFSSREVEPEKLRAILDAACLAPSGRNRQPWRFIVVRGKDNIEYLVRRAFNEVNYPAIRAPVIIVICANPTDGIAVGGREYYLLDAGMAAENMLLAATAMGLATHAIAGVEEKELKRILKIPPELRFVLAIPVAYPTGSTYEEAAQEKLSERSRKKLDEIACSNSWGEPLSI
ncbi:nitroreductase family protein [Chloroflexota bacterium]